MPKLAAAQHLLRRHDAVMASRSWRVRTRHGGDALLPVDNAAVDARTRLQSVRDAREGLHHVRVEFHAQEMSLCLGCVIVWFTRTVVVDIYSTNDNDKPNG